MVFDSDKKTSVSVTEPSTGAKATFSTDIPEAALPKLVVCFDLSTLSLQELQTIASDLNLPDYDQMTKEQLCETLLAL